MSWQDILKNDEPNPKELPYLTTSFGKEGWFVGFSNSAYDEPSKYKEEGIYPPEQYGRRSFRKLATMLFEKYPSYDFIYFNDKGEEKGISRESI